MNKRKHLTDDIYDIIKHNEFKRINDEKKDIIHKIYLVIKSLEEIKEDIEKSTDSENETFDIEAKNSAESHFPFIIDACKLIDANLTDYSLDMDECDDDDNVD